MADNCIHCQHPVRAKQQGIQCDGCLKWNHRTCNTGISQQQCRGAVRAGAEMVWFCPPCRPDPVAESSRVSGECDTFNQSNYILESEEFNPPRESFDQSTIYDPQSQEVPADPIQEESSILEPEPQEVNGTFNLEFEMVEDSSKRGRPKLVDNRGYSVEGFAVLHGTEENVLKNFQIDESGQKFAKEKAVTLVIQLIDKSMGAAGAAAASSSFVPPGAYYSGGPTGPMSTPTPPPVPD